MVLPRNTSPRHPYAPNSIPYSIFTIYTRSIDRPIMLHSSRFSKSLAIFSSPNHSAFYPLFYSAVSGSLPGEECVMDPPSKNVERDGAQLNSSNESRRLVDEILPHIINLYASRATAQDFEIYSATATFEDPLMCAHGVKQIKSAFYSLSKVFSESRIVEYNVKENVISPGKHEILIDNKQFYKFMGRGIDMISLIKLDVEGGKVIRHEDRWDKKPLLNRETVHIPLVGRVIEMARRGSMFATHVLMRFGKDPTS